MIPIDGKIMFEIAPRFSGARGQRQAQIISEVGAVLQSTLEKYKIDNTLRIAHFLAQTCHESAGFRTTEEFASGEAYEGRSDLGNTKPGDGKRYKGRGLLQLTGRANYRSVGKKLKLKLEEDPLLAADPATSLLIACEYWKSRTINPDCNRDDIITVTRKVNGGLNGIDDRRHYLTKAKAALARITGLQVSGANPGDDRPVLTRGSTGDAVMNVQILLRKLGFPLAVDADYGPATELAIIRFQMDNKLEADGIIGPATWDALEKAAKKK